MLFFRNFNRGGVHAVCHYEPLGSPNSGMQLELAGGDLDNANALLAQLIGLPLWSGIKELEQTFFDNL